jgi:Domain of unknown function (DUF1707)/Cell wall-active antibiotics response 4TMS YvqF
MDQGDSRLTSRGAGALTPRPTTEERDRVIAILSEAFAGGALDVDEFERRVTVAHRSDAPAEVRALVADLPARAPALAPGPSRAMVPAALVRRSGLVLSIMGGSVRQGPWTVPRTLNVVSLMGGARIDLREARLPAGTVEIRVAAMMGGVEIIVPPHLAVEASGAAIMGGFEHVERAPAEPDPAAPLLRVTGLAIMGGVHIEMRLQGESERDARRRRRRERKLR